MKIYLHVGMHKTGTTTVQKCLAGNTATLKKAGYKIFVNSPYLMAKRPGLFRPDWIKKTVQSCAQQGYDAVVFSAEAMSTFNSTQMTDLASCFGGYEVVVVAVFRHWAGFLPSRWKQNCSRRDTQSFPAYLAALEEHHSRHLEANYGVVVKNMLSTGAEFRALSYDNALSHQDLLLCVLKALDLPHPIALSLSDGAESVHRSAATRIYDICRLFNGVYSLRTGREPNALFNSILTHGEVEQFYDFRNAIARFCGAPSGLLNTLLVANKQSQVTLTLSKDAFPDWDTAASTAIGKYLLNPVDTQLFSAPKVRDVTCSTLEVSDLDEVTLSRMERQIIGGFLKTG